MRCLRIMLPILFLLGAIPTLVSGQDTNTPIRANNVAQLSIIASWEVPEDACVQFSNDWHTLLVNDGRQLLFYDLMQGKEAARSLGGEYPCEMLFAGDNETLLFVDGQEIRMQDANTGEVLQNFNGHTEEVISVAISPDSRYLATSQPYGIRLFDMETGAMLQHFTQEANGNIVYGGAVFFSPDRTRLAAATEGGIYIWDLATGEWVDVYNSYRTDSFAFYSPDGTRMLVYSNLSANFRLLDATNGAELRTGIYLSPDAIAFSPNSQYLAITSSSNLSDKRLDIYGTATGNLHLSMTHESKLATFSPDATLLATAADKLYFWDTATGDALANYTLGQEISHVAFRDNGTQFVTLADNTVALWQVTASDDSHTLGDSSTSISTVVQCPGFMLSRLTIAAEARVLPGPPNNVRAEAQRNAEKMGEIPAGAIITVLAGPVCADNIAWWQVDYQGLVGWTAEGADNEYYLEPMP